MVLDDEDGTHIGEKGQISCLAKGVTEHSSGPIHGAYDTDDTFIDVNWLVSRHHICNLKFSFTVKRKVQRIRSYATLCFLVTCKWRSLLSAWPKFVWIPQLGARPVRSLREFLGKKKTVAILPGMSMSFFNIGFEL